MQKLSIFPYFHPKTAKKGHKSAFYAKCAKYSNFCTIKTTNAIPTKFCTVIKTTKFSFFLFLAFNNYLARSEKFPEGLYILPMFFLYFF